MIKNIYNLDSEYSASDWVREELTDKKCVKEFPHLSSSITVTTADNQKAVDGFLGCYVGLSNNIYQSNSGVGMYSSIAKYGNSNVSLSVLPENFEKMCTMFTVRKSVKSEWYNQKDEYFAPKI